MKCFITGITGFIGSNIARQLLMDGHEVHALIRNSRHPDLPDLQGIAYFLGNLGDSRILETAMKGCEVVYHLAAYARPWSKDPGEYHRINVEGAVNVFTAARNAGVKKVVFTSSAATMSPSPGEVPVDESTPRKQPYFHAYESTKAEAEQKAIEFSQAGLPVVIVNPSRVYGPGPINPSNSVTRLILLYQQGRMRFIPGDGKKIGNYVYIDDVVQGHILAAQHGRAGQRYILGGENLSFDELFRTMGSVCGKQRRIIHIPLPFLIAAASIMEGQAKITGIPPLIVPAFVKKYLSHWSLSSDKAARELGYKITPFAAGVERTLEWHNLLRTIAPSFVQNPNLLTKC